MSAESPAYNPRMNRVFQSARRATGEISRLLDIEVIGREHIESLEGEPAIFLFAPHKGHADEAVAYKKIEEVPQYRNKVIIPAARYMWYKRTFGFIPVRETLSNLFAPNVPFSNRVEPDWKADLDNLARLMNEDGYSILFAPEGTRRRRPLHKRRFKGGAFSLAFATGRPIVPVGLAGFEKVMHRKSKIPRLVDRRLRRRKVTVCFGEPYVYSSTEDSTINRRAAMDDLKKAFDKMDIWGGERWLEDV